jgi:hypothetical protein
MGITAAGGLTPGRTRVFDVVLSQTTLSPPLGSNLSCLPDGSLALIITPNNSNLVGSISINGSAVIQSIGVPLIIDGKASIFVAGNLSLDAPSTLVTVGPNSSEILTITDCVSFSGDLIVNASIDSAPGAYNYTIAKYGCLAERFAKVEIRPPNASTGLVGPMSNIFPRAFKSLSLCARLSPRRAPLRALEPSKS